MISCICFSCDKAPPEVLTMAAGLDHLSIVLNCKAPGGYKTKGAG